MQTYSHFIITILLNRQVKKNQERVTDSGNPTGQTQGRFPPLRTRASLLGSLAPDIPLITITIIFLISDLSGGRLGPGSDGSGSSVEYLFRYMFFNEPWVKAVHNLFHAPILTVASTAAGYLAWRYGRKWGAALFWFGLACTIHTAIDIPLHYDDGPLLFFPFEWQTRLYSPVSYWDPARYGQAFAVFEHLLILGLIIYLIVDWWLARRRRAKVSAA